MLSDPESRAEYDRGQKRSFRFDFSKAKDMFKREFKGEKH